MISQGLLPASRRIAWKIRPPVLALGGGGARGFAHIGVLRELDRADLPIRSIVGCSMGALVGGMYATLGSADAVFDRWREALDRGLIPTLRLITVPGDGAGRNTRSSGRPDGSATA